MLMTKDKEQNNFLIDSIIFSLVINWHPYLNSKELTYFSLYQFLWLSVIPVIPILTISPTRDNLI